MGKPHPENLRPCTPENAAARGRVGGKSQSDFKRWTHQKFCNRRCVFHDRCPAISSSRGLNPVIQGRLKNYPCFIKAQPDEVQNYFKNLFLDGEEGVIKLIMELAFRYIIETRKKPTTKALKEAIETALAMKKGIYGDKQKVELEGHVRIVAIPKEIENV